MSFLNKKEQVYDIKLTPYGKEQLANGGLEFSFYSFYDDDVIYDMNYAGFEETQNDIEGRIKESLRNKTSYNFVNIENKELYQQEEKESMMKNFGLASSLGSSELGKREMPAFSVKFLKGELESFEQFLSTEYHKLPYPQLGTSITFETSIKQGQRPDEEDLLEGEIFEDGITDPNYLINYEGVPFEDGTFIKVDGETILLQLEELNSLFENENFELEVYLVEEDEFLKGQKLTQLKFIDGTSEEELEQDITNDFVEYYLDIQTDNEIPNEEFCNIGKSIKFNNPRFNERLDCPPEDVIVTNPEIPYNDPNNPENIC